MANSSENSSIGCDAYNPVERHTACGKRSADMETVAMDQTKYLPTKLVIMVFLACAMIDFTAMLDQTMLAGGLSVVSSALQAGQRTAWISGAFFLTSTSFQLLYGRLSDVLSRKLVLLTGLTIFFLGSLAASVSQTSTQLIVFRAFTGIGGGGLMTIAQAIIGDIVPLRERGKYQGILGVANALANGVGPVIGGALASASPGSWRWIFRLNMPLAFVAAGGAIFFMPIKKVEGSKWKNIALIDWFGVILALGSSTSLILSLSWAGVEYSWSSAQVLSSVIVGVLGLSGFFLWQGVVKCPLIPLRIFRSKLVNGACFTTFLNGWIGLVQVYNIPMFYQVVFGYSALKSAALLLPITITQSLSSTFAGLLITWTGRYRECLILGWAIWAIALGLFSTLDTTSGLGKQIGFALLVGVGIGQTFQPTLIAAQAGCERRDMAVITSFRSFLRNGGGTIGLAVTGTVINNILKSRLENSDFELSHDALQKILEQPEIVSHTEGVNQAVMVAIRDAYSEGFRTIFWIASGLAASAVILVLILMPQVDLNRADDREKLAGDGTVDGIQGGEESAKS